MSKLEKSVSSDVKNTLSALELAGAVLWWERLNVGKVKTQFGSWIHLCREGTADFLAILPVTNGVMVYFIECKSDTGIQKPKQSDFQKKAESWGAIYEIVTDVKQVKTTVENITGFFKQKINEINY